MRDGYSRKVTALRATFETGKPARDTSATTSPGNWTRRARVARAPTDLERVLAMNAGALLTALAIGERHLFEDEHWEVFRRTGNEPSGGDIGVCTSA